MGESNRVGEENEVDAENKGKSRRNPTKRSLRAETTTREWQLIDWALPCPRIAKVLAGNQERRVHFLETAFDLQPPSSLLELNGSARTIEYWTERILRVKESSLDPLFRSFRYSLEFPVLPHSSLSFHATMQNQSVSPPMSTPRQPQSVAALLPEEILDSIFAQFGFNYSMDANARDRMERFSILSHMSVVAEGWTRLARRLVFRTVRIKGWTHLQEVEEGLGKQVRDSEITGAHRDGVPSLEVAGAVLKVLKQVPNLRQLRLVALRFDSFNTADSVSMHAAVLLPHLHDLYISDIPSPHSLIVDLLATSDHRLARLTVFVPPERAASPSTPQQLDFRGNLRFLSTWREFYRTLVDSVSLGGIEGLTELDLRDTGVISSNREAEFFRIVGPTLRTLQIHCKDVTPFAELLPLLNRLSKLSVRSHYANPAPLLLCLPPFVSLLQLADDKEFGPSLARWIATPFLVPEGLKQIQIDYIYKLETYQQLPPIPTLCNNYRSDTMSHLRRLSPGTLPFKTLEMYFPHRYLDQRSDVEAECSRVGVVFRQRVEYWDD